MAVEQDPLFAASGGGPPDPPQPRWDRDGVIRAGHDLAALDLRFADGWWLTLRRPYDEGRIIVPPPNALRPICACELLMDEPSPDPCAICERPIDRAPSSPRRAEGWSTAIAPTGRRVADLRPIPAGLWPSCECWDGLLSRDWEIDYGGDQPPDMHLTFVGQPCDSGFLPPPHGLIPSEHGCV